MVLAGPCLGQFTAYDGPSVLATIAWTLGGVLAVGVAWRLWRRTPDRRRPGPATCRRCGYDVSRRPPDVEICSECGTDLTRPGATVHFARRRRPWRATTATLAASAVVLAAGRSGWQFPWAEWVPTALPVAWVASHARGDPAASGDRWRHEWLARGDARQRSAFFDHAIDLCLAGGALDAGIAYEVAWALYRDDLDDAQIRRLLDALVVEPTWVTVHGTDGRPTGFVLSADVPRALRPLLDLVDSRAELPAGHAGRFRLRLDPRTPERPVRGTPIPLPDGWTELPPGRHVLPVVYRRQFTRGFGRDLARSRPFGPSAEIALTLTVDVVPRGWAPPPVPPADAPPDLPPDVLADAVSRSVRVVACLDPSGSTVGIFADMAPADVPRAFSVWARVDGGPAVHAGIIAAGTGRTARRQWMHLKSVDPGTRPSRVDVDFVGTGDASVARGGAYWAGTVSFRDVEVQPPTVFGDLVSSGRP